MSLLARGIAYLSAVLIAVGGAEPWVTVNGDPGGASPLGIAAVLGLATAVTLATALRRRGALRLIAVAAGLLAVAVLWTAPNNVLVASAAHGELASHTASGLSLILLGALLVYAAASLPAPRRRAVPDPTAEPGQEL